MSQVVGSNSSYKPTTNTAWVRTQLCKLQKQVCTRLSAASDKVYQLLVQDRWFSPGTPASSTTKTGRHDIGEIQLKVALNTRYQFKYRYQGRIQDLWLWGREQARGLGTASSAGPRQSPGRGPRGLSPLEALGIEELQTFI